MNIQIIEKDGKPEWAVIAYDDYLKLIEELELQEDIRELERIRAAIASGEEELVPSHVVYALLEGENPLKVWREYRGLSHDQLAAATGISVAELVRLEVGGGLSQEMVTQLAHALHIEAEELGALMAENTPPVPPP